MEGNLLANELHVWCCASGWKGDAQVVGKKLQNVTPSSRCITHVCHWNAQEPNTYAAESPAAGLAMHLTRARGSER